MSKFCPKCGKTIQSGTFCADCKKENISFKPIKIQLCPSKRFFYKGKWAPFKDLKTLSKKLVAENVQGKVKLLHGLETFEDLLKKPGLKRELELVVASNLETYSVPVSVEITYSPGVGKLGSTYFEGILQLRNATDEVKKYVREFIAKNTSKRIYVNKVAEKGSSVDYYFVSKHHIYVVAMKIIRNFGGFIIQNPQLFSRDKQRSKDLYRLNTLVELPLFRVGDVIAKENDLILVKKTSKEISGINLIKNKHTSFHFTLRNKDSISLIEVKKTSVINTRPSIMILNPDTYQEEIAKNPLNLKLKTGQKVKVVSFKKNFYIIS